MLILVRHAMPEQRPSVAPEHWVLAADGVVAAARLVTALPAGARLVASTEPKAWQTLAAGGTVERDVRFNEVRRQEPYDDGFRARRRSYVEGAGPASWEPREAVAARFAAGIAEHLHRAAGRPLVVATHGMAMTSWLVEAIGLAEPGPFWAALRLPDAYTVDQAAGTVSRLPFD